MRYLFSLLQITLLCGLVVQTDTPSKFISTSVNQYGEIQFKVYTKTSDRYEFVLEKKKNNIWVHERAGGMQTCLAIIEGGTVAIKARPERDTINNFFFVKFHKGINEYRVKMNFPEQAVSEPFVLNAESSNDTEDLWILHDSIRLDQPVYYEILNNVGATVTKGEAKIIGIKGLQRGNYFLYTKRWTKTFVVE